MSVWGMLDRHQQDQPCWHQKSWKARERGADLEPEKLHGQRESQHGCFSPGCALVLAERVSSSVLLRELAETITRIEQEKQKVSGTQPRARRC